jgi:hypothetical protein
MGDCRLCSLVRCHDHSAQILEFFHWLALGVLAGALVRERENPVRQENLSGKCSSAAAEGSFPPSHNLRRRTFPKKFPQANV